MTTETMTIHRALAELKVLENRINKVIYDAKFCAAVKQSMKKVNGVSLEDFKVASQSSLDMVRDLIARQEAIKRRFLCPTPRRSLSLLARSIVWPRLSI